MRALPFALALALALALAPFAQAEEKGDCGTIVLPTGAGEAGADDITSFSPLFSNAAYNEESAAVMYPNLLWINRFFDIDWSRSLASAVTTTDNTNFLITMRPWHWSDGVPVTAGDVAYYFDLAKALGPDWPGYGGGGLPNIVKTMKVLSPAQLLITTTHSVNPQWFLYNGISSLSPLPEHVWKHYTLDQMRQLQSSPAFYSVVDGPLELARFDVGLDAVFVPNPAWEGPKMHFSRLVFRFLQGDGASVQGVESGDLDEGQLPNDLYDSIHHVPGLHVEVLPQTTYQDVIIVNFHNPKVAFFRDVRVRQAMIDSIDQAAIIKGYAHGNADPSYGVVTASMTKFLTPEMKKGIYPVGYDPVKARALLAAAGWKPGKDGIMVKDGRRLSFDYLEESGTDTITELDEIVQQDMRKVGIEMKLHLVEFNQLLALMDGPPDGWEATGVGKGTSDYPTGESQYATGSYQNQGGYSDPKMDALIKASTDQPGIQNLYDFETYLSAQQPVIFGTPRTRPVILVNDRLHGMKNFLNPATFFSPDALYCSAPDNKEAQE
jgi:peptide/nickel transport system substrate-binding protein